MDVSAFRCPRCHGHLSAHTERLECDTASCGLLFPVVRGVPVLIDEGKSMFRLSDYAGDPLSKPEQSAVQRFALRWLPSLDLNVAAKHNVHLMKALLFSGGVRPKILSIGSKHPSGAMSSLCDHPDVECVSCDLVYADGVDVIADPVSLPFSDGVFDGLLVDAVLEHCIDPQGVVREIHRVLRSGGYVYSDTPFMIPVHAGAYDFCRFSALAHRLLFNGFRQVEHGVSSGPAAALGYSIQSVLLAFTSSRRFRFAVKGLCRLLFFWIKYLDLLLARRPGALDAALGTYFIGERLPEPISDQDLLACYAGAVPDLYVRSIRD